MTRTQKELKHGHHTDESSSEAAAENLRAGSETLKQRSAGQLPPLASTSLSSLEREWRDRIHSRLLEVMDLSLIGTVEDSQARTQIREISQRLMVELSAPLEH
jgi:hypothetical protein